MSDELPSAPNKAHQALLARVSAFCRLAVRRAEVDGIAVGAANGYGGLDLIHVTDQRAEKLSDLEFVLGQGPALDCFASRRPVAVADLSADDSYQRWPMFAPAAELAGAAAIQVLPLVGTGRVLGAVTLYRTSPGMLTLRQFRHAESATEMIDLALVSPDVPAGVGTPLRMLVHQAAGMLMEQTGRDIHDALVFLRATAYSESKPVAELADEVVNGGRRFTRIEARE